MAHPYCLHIDVQGRLLMTDAEYLSNNNADMIETATLEASCYVDSRIPCLIPTPLTMSACCIRYATADFATSLYKRRTFKSRGGEESFDTRFWWEMGEKKLDKCIESLWKCGVVTGTEYGK